MTDQVEFEDEAACRDAYRALYTGYPAVAEDSHVWDSARLDTCIENPSEGGANGWSAT